MSIYNYLLIIPIRSLCPGLLVLFSFLFLLLCIRGLFTPFIILSSTEYSVVRPDQEFPDDDHTVP